MLMSPSNPPGRKRSTIRVIEQATKSYLLLKLKLKQEMGLILLLKMQRQHKRLHELRLLHMH